MKTIFTFLVLILTLQLGVYALPEEAKREIQRLREFENKARKEVEKQIISEKKAAIRQLEKLSKSIKDKEQMWIKKLADIQIEKYQAEITKSEATISGNPPKAEKPKDLPKMSLEDIKNADKIINFGDTYMYKHPSEDFKNQQCEITLEKDGTAHVIHKEGKHVKFDTIWTWKYDKSKIKIDADKSHGPIYITRRGIREIFVNYRGNINRKVSAKIK